MSGCVPMTGPMIVSVDAQVDLLAAVDPQCVNMAMVTPGSSLLEREMNAKYVISTTRKLGCCIFLLW